MKRLSNIPVGVFAVGIAGMLCATAALAQTPQFAQVSPLFFTMPVGSNPLAQTVTVVSTGANFNFTATAQAAGGGGWLQVDSPCRNNSSPAPCSISVNAATLSAGVYTGQVVFSNGGTAMTVSVTLTVKGTGAPFFGGVSGGLNFVSGSGFSAAPQNVQINNADNGALNWTAAVSTFKTSTVGNTNWLSVSSTTGIAPSLVTVSASPQGLTPGIYIGQVLFQAASSSVTIPVSLVVVDSKNITFEQAPGVNFTMPVGSNPLAQTVTVVSTGANFNFTATAQTAGGGGWLQVDSTCRNNSSPAPCSISVNAATLSAGIYTGQVVFSNGGTAMTVPVTLAVKGAGAPFFGGVSGGLNFVSGSGFSAAPQNVQINNADTGVLNWTATVSMFRTSTAGNTNWLSVSSTTGIAPSLVTVSVLAQGLPPGIYLGQVLFQAASSSITIPVSLVVADSNNITFEQVPGVTFTMPVGANPLPQTITIVSTGANFNFTATAQTAGGGDWLQVASTCRNNSSPAPCSISVSATTLSAGIYTGQVVFSNGGTAMAVPVTLTVKGAGVPFFGGVAGELNFVSGSGFSPAPQNVQINNAGTGVLNWTATVSMFRTATVIIAGQFSDVNWLSASSTSGIAPSIVTVSVSPQGLPPGIYLGQVLFQAASSSVTIPVSLVVVDSKNTTFQQVPGVNFTMPVGANPLPQTVTIVSTGANFNFTATAQTASGGDWLQVASTCRNNSSPAPCSISVNAATLSAGIYTGQVDFSNGGTAVTVPVTLTVKGAGVPVFGGIAGGLSFVSGSGLSPAPQNVRIDNAGTDVLNWTATVSMFRTATVVIAGQFSDVNWLSASSTSGIAPSIVTVSVSPQGLPPGIYLGQVLFQAASSSVTIPVSLVVADSNNIAIQQVPGVNFTMPVGANPLAQTVTILSTGANFNFAATAQTAGGGDWLQVASTCRNNSSPAPCSISVNATTLSSGIYIGQVVFNNGSTAMTVPVTLTVGNPGSGGNKPVTSANGVVNGASFLAGIVPGSFATIFGTNLASTTTGKGWDGSITNGQLPTQIDGVSVSIGGKPAYIAYIRQDQINIQVPDAGVGPVQVTVTNSGGTSDPVMVTSQQFGPAFFLTGGKYAVAQHYPDYGYSANPSVVPGTVAAKPGDILILWGTGFGPTNPAVPAGQVPPPTGPSVTGGGAPVTVTVGGVSAQLISAVLSPYAADYQIAIKLPSSLPNGDTPIRVSIGSYQSPNNVYIYVQN